MEYSSFSILKEYKGFNLLGDGIFLQVEVSMSLAVNPAI